MNHDLKYTKMLYKYVASPRTYCYYCNVLILVGDKVFYKGQELGVVKEELTEMVEKKYKHHGNYWQQIVLS